MQTEFRDWIAAVREVAKEDRREAVLRGLFYTYLGLWHTASSRIEMGTNVFDREWDVLIILDACRVDALRAVAPEYDFLDDVESIWSVGSGSHEWTARTFTTDHEEAISNTILTTANGFSHMAFHERSLPPRHPTPISWIDNRTVTADAFQGLDEAWREGRQNRFGVVVPQRLTDRAIHLSRKRSPEKLITHYLQPHYPYIANGVRNDEELTPLEEEHIWLLQEGRVDYDDVWEAYLDNLRLVLDQVAILRNNIDAERIAITADHGEAFGEFGVYGHPEAFPHPVSRKVPWATTTGEGSGTHDPDPAHLEGIDETAVGSADESSVKQHLADLGYY